MSTRIDTKSLNKENVPPIILLRLLISSLININFNVLKIQRYLPKHVFTKYDVYSNRKL